MTIGIRECCLLVLDTVTSTFVTPVLSENPSFSSSAMKLESGNMTPVNLDLSAAYIHTVVFFVSVFDKLAKMTCVLSVSARIQHVIAHGLCRKRVTVLVSPKLGTKFFV